MTGVYRVGGTGRGKVSLIRVRNPWGDRNEWRGDWSDGHAKWDQVCSGALGVTQCLLLR